MALSPLNIYPSKIIFFPDDFEGNRINTIKVFPNFFTGKTLPTPNAVVRLVSDY
jgi:hypothetical protein